MRRHFFTLLKIGVTLAGLAYVLAQVPLAEIRTEFAGIRWSWVIVAFILIILGVLVRAYRWLLLLRGLGVAVAFKRLVAIYFVGGFFSTFLPSGFGGDVVRIFEVAQNVPRNVAAGTVIVDRLLGMLMLFVMALLALPFRPASFPDSLLGPIVGICVIGLAGGVVLLEGSLIRRLGRKLPGKLSVVDERQPLARLLRAVQGSGRQAILRALAASAILNLMLTGWWMAAGLALGYPISYLYFLLIVPILSVALLAPSVGGLGVNETLAPLLFAGAGLAPAQAVTLSLLVFILLRLAGLFGAPIYIVSAIRAVRAQRERSAKAAESA
ncbi:MAG TPA: lysylphosphatidylglycerol synthase transmembrane domain-containing protein [Anaerolineae bacterium]